MADADSTHSTRHSTPHRAPRSFVIRAGRCTAAQREALARHWDDYVIEPGDARSDFQKHFTRERPLTVEIGFGMGDSLLQMAKAAPEENFLGIEVHRPGIGKLLHGLHEADIDNVRIISQDAVEMLRRHFQPDSIDRLLILFPDPWPKKRHHKRRLINPGFTELLPQVLRPGGRLHLATDWEPYATWMLEVLENQAGLVNANGAGQFWTEPDRPATKFQRRGERLGHGVWDLLYLQEG